MLHSAPVNFGSWHDLIDASRVAPARAGVLQARARTLLSFPAGKSAMVLYASSGADETLQRYVEARGAGTLARAAATGATLVRFGVTPRPDAELTRLLDQFSARFGALPPGNRAAPAPSGSSPDIQSSNKDGFQGERQGDGQPDGQRDGQGDEDDGR